MVFYSMVWNWTLTWKSPYLESQQTQYPKDDMLIRLKMSIDNAVFEYFEKNDSFSLRVETCFSTFDNYSYNNYFSLSTYLTFSYK